MLPAVFHVLLPFSDIILRAKLYLSYLSDFWGPPQPEHHLISISHNVRETISLEAGPKQTEAAHSLDKLTPRQYLEERQRKASEKSSISLLLAGLALVLWSNTTGTNIANGTSIVVHVKGQS